MKENIVLFHFYVDTIRFYQNEKKKVFHFAMIGGILNFISFCVDTMWLVVGNAGFETFQISTIILLSFVST